MSTHINPSTVELLKRPDAHLVIHQALSDEDLKEALGFFRNLAEMLNSLTPHYDVCLQSVYNTLGLLAAAAERRGFKKTVQRKNGIFYYV